MILRYFYFEQYKGIVEDLDFNLGGEYKFYFKKFEKYLQIINDEQYVKNLYIEYNVISDVSAILGKNSSGKTTVLRMINSIFNGFNSFNSEKYIVLFENEDSYILYTNYEYLEYSENILNKKLKCIRQKFLDSINVLRNVGVIYFSNIFDKATPFDGNANLIDISTNYTFEKFYEEKIKNRKLKDDEKSNIMDEYKASCILQEIDFLIDMDKEDKINLLFEIPKEIEIGFIQTIGSYKNISFCDNIEWNELLVRIYQSMDTFLGNQEENEISIFRDEIIFYFMFDFLCELCREGYHEVFVALEYWKDKIEKEEWNLCFYYKDILDKLQNNYEIKEIITDTLIKDTEFQEIDYEDIVEDFIWIQDTLNKLHNIKFDLVLRKIFRIENFNMMKKFRAGNKICSYLKEARYLIEELQSDLLYHDYDLYNLSYVYDAISLIECANSLFINDCLFFNDLDDEYIMLYDSEVDDDEGNNEKIDMDADTGQRLELLTETIEIFLSFVERYQFDNSNNMLNVRLDNQDILKFIYNFQELNCETIELEVKRNDISSGHSAYLDMCARINLARKSGEIRNKDNVILLVDEGDIYLHPEKQLGYLNNLLKLLQILYKDKKVQIIITSNSPFIVSDIQTSNILYLENNKGRISVTKGSISNTFASNVNNLLIDSFFIKNSLIGEFAFEKINSILKDILRKDITEEKFEYIKDILEIIGEPIIRKKLEHMLFYNIKDNNLQKEIEYYEKKLARMKKNNDRK